MNTTEQPANSDMMDDVIPDIKQESAGIAALVMNKMNEGVMPTHVLNLNEFHFQKAHYEQLDRCTIKHSPRSTMDNIGGN